MSSIIEHVRNSINARDYYSGIFGDALRWPTGAGGEPRVNCCFHVEKTPSLSLNGETGAFYCHGCGTGGNSIIDFQAKYDEIERRDAAVKLFAKHIHPVVEERMVRKWHKALLVTPSAMNFLTKDRFINRKVIEKYEIGWTGERITFPIRNEFGLTVNVKLYDPIGKRHGQPKMINYKIKGQEHLVFGSPAEIYPIGVLTNTATGKSALDLSDPLFICEGELDALALISMGLQAVSTTAGAKSWPEQHNHRFKAAKVAIAYDNDKDGTTWDRKAVLANLKRIVRRAARIEIPTEMGPQAIQGKDVTDWLKYDPSMRSRQAWKSAAKQGKRLVFNPQQNAETIEVQEVPLDQASQARWYSKRLKVSALISGKDAAPYILPRRFRATCNHSCDTCPLADKGKEYLEKGVNPSDPTVLALVDAPEPKVQKHLLALAGMGQCTKECEARAEVTETFNLEQIMLIPTLGSGTNQYVNRTAYYVGHGLYSNRAYEFEGLTVPHPVDQHATHLFDASKPVQDEIETFKLTPELGKRLKVFQPNRMRLFAHLVNMAEWQSKYITKIRQRPDLHIAVDLVYHSVQGFEFNGEYVRRGMLDALIIGDTRCGKGYVAEGLKRYYGVGEIASGENCTFAGLIGGCQQVGKRWIITWGMIPLNHNRQVTIDEATGLSEVEFGRMSRVRSEGVAEINKIIREHTQASTRLLWLSNCRDGRPIMKRNHGVEAIRDLVGNNEDVSRFDFALTVATNEVPSDVINIRAEEAGRDADRYPADLCRMLVLWAWSRRPDQVRFTPSAIDEIIKASIIMGNKYSAEIPLVQAENIRIKLAKIAASIAARTFSTDESYEQLIIDERHVQAAKMFLDQCYTKPSMGYDVFSAAATDKQVFDSTDPIAKIFGRMNTEVRENTMDGLIALHRITPEALGDYMGDREFARITIGDLLKVHCLTRIETSGGWYLKNPAFTKWLREQRQPRLNGWSINGHANHSESRTR